MRVLRRTPSLLVANALSAAIQGQFMLVLPFTLLETLTASLALDLLCVPNGGGRVGMAEVAAPDPCEASRSRSGRCPAPR